MTDVIAWSNADNRV